MWRSQRRRRRERVPGEPVMGGYSKYIWGSVNVGFVLLGLFGSMFMTPVENAHYTNPGPFFFVFALFVLPLFSVGAVQYSVRARKQDTFQRPTWNRNPLNWWHDPFQSLFISTCYVVATTLGSSVNFLFTNFVNFWPVVMSASLTNWAHVAWIRFLAYQIYPAAGFYELWLGRNSQNGHSSGGN